MPTTRLLFIDDEADMRDLVREALSSKGFEVHSTASVSEGLGRIREGSVDVVVTDLNLDGTSGLDVCKRVAECSPDVPVIVLTGFGSMESAVSAIRAGAYDFITKPIDMEQLALTVNRATQLLALRQEAKRLRDRVVSPSSFGTTLGESTAMRRMFDLLERVADSDSTVLVTGESGTGKELVARALHDSSRRKDGPFIAVHCAALPEALLESELFGHVKGAFTDAKGQKTGLFVAANGGTLFLDEIGEMPLSTQVKLLRALQERTVRPVGSDQEVPFDARIVAATNRDVENEVAERRFREDLYYRLNVVRVKVPPLRARDNDVLVIAQAYLNRFARESGRPVRAIGSRAASKLLAYDWPGNVRELQNCIERAVALTRDQEIAVDDLPHAVRDFRPKDDGPTMPPEDAKSEELVELDELARRHILRTLRALHGNKTLAAQVLGLDRRTLYRRLERYGAMPRSRSTPPPESGDRMTVANLPDRGVPAREAPLPDRSGRPVGEELEAGGSRR
ncbi:MAG TPA: sigma-54 dependent transcriptional regulator [Polyangiaceae bacterium]|nr:sigma-54 dependent transcriptional regulator [Polyangiaceae bacterium]